MFLKVFISGALIIGILPKPRYYLVETENKQSSFIWSGPTTERTVQAKNVINGEAEKFAVNYLIDYGYLANSNGLNRAQKYIPNIYRSGRGTENSYKMVWVCRM